MLEGFPLFLDAMISLCKGASIIRTGWKKSVSDQAKFAREYEDLRNDFGGREIANSSLVGPISGTGYTLTRVENIVLVFGSHSFRATNRRVVRIASKARREHMNTVELAIVWRALQALPMSKTSFDTIESADSARITCDLPLKIACHPCSFRVYG